MILLMGIAGSGKGTQSKLLAENDGFNVISTGDLLRTYGSEDQHRRMMKGEILGDQEVTALLEKALDKTSDQDNVILDGYPRRISQAEWLLDQAHKGRFELTSVIHLKATKEAVLKRLQERGRLDDHDDGIERRFSEFEQDTVPILNYFIRAGIKVSEINAEESVDAVHEQIVHLLKDSII